MGLTSKKNRETIGNNTELNILVRPNYEKDMK
jgi:hypothetical protein